VPAAVKLRTSSQFPSPVLFPAKARLIIARRRRGSDTAIDRRAAAARDRFAVMKKGASHHALAAAPISDNHG
jgi:hypothetical protein